MGAAIDLGIEIVRPINTGLEKRRKGDVLAVPDEVPHNEACRLVDGGAAKWRISEEFAMLAATDVNAAKRTRCPRGHRMLA